MQSPFDQLLTCAFKPYHEKPYIIQRNPDEQTDRKLILTVRDELEKYDMLISYYGIRYDVSFLNGRLYKHGERPLKRMLHVDCYRIAKKIFNWTIHSRRLATICEHLNIPGKTRVTPKDWETVKYYHDSLDKRAALKKIAHHNVYDVIVLEKAYDKCFKQQITSISIS